MNTKRYLTGALVASLVLNIVLIYKTTYIKEVAVVPSSPSTETPASTTSEHVSGTTYPFIRVVDGDTVVVGVEGKSEYVRLIGIDSPEPNDPDGPECYATEATEHIKDLARTGTVVLHFDPTQGYRDTYGRLLAYIGLPDGTDLGLAMVRDGYAREYTYNQPYERQTTYKEAEEQATTNKSGLWAEGACATNMNQ
ncbi:MAG: thermonuclease family protein [Candidatus Pacebacteria bacterium]|nr:thermonuclease family protein [Candidatus Paceibacterota bacterium]